MTAPRTLVAMSGGVDSSVAALLLARDGVPAATAYMKNWINEIQVVGHCPWEEDVRFARAVSDQLGLEFEVINLMKDYQERVVDYLLQAYREGVTPNPDVMCNREIKFGVFLAEARRRGFGRIATGHYARTRAHPDGTVDLLTGRDPGKDQSYFLALLRQDQVAAACFPLGDLLKSQVRELAREQGLANAARKDSQGICFIGEVNMNDFLRMYLPREPGPMINTAGKVVGTHEGLHFYTLGQRRGLGVPSNTFGEHYVVVAKRPEDNALILAFDRPDSPGLWSRQSRVRGLSTVNRPLPDGAASFQARPRYRAPSAAIRFERTAEDEALITWQEPQRALAPGQICAFYDGDLVLGGAVFEEILYDGPNPN